MSRLTASLPSAYKQANQALRGTAVGHGRNKPNTPQQPERFPMKAQATGQEPGMAPYCAKTIDAALAHLERALSIDVDCTIFDQRYWRQRLMHLYATPGLLPAHRARVQRLLDGLLAMNGGAASDTASEAASRTQSR
ncbi:hypothetical protein [Paraburkholderia tropica]|uniref:hypothetical protein n=1 Tax=Paraburkholderia tropica TaxID=92647 RepID=UPI001CC6F1C5|nr:hypothetical protein [Paraburkholderia tropica]